jgi:hypothetical protein
LVDINLFKKKRSMDWFADSGATQHMTDQRNLLINFVPAGLEQWNVSGIGGTNLSVLGQGDVVISAVVNGKTLEGTFLCSLGIELSD